MFIRRVLAVFVDCLDEQCSEDGLCYGRVINKIPYEKPTQDTGCPKYIKNMSTLEQETSQKQHRKSKNSKHP